MGETCTRIFHGHIRLAGASSQNRAFERDLLFCPKWPVRALLSRVVVLANIRIRCCRRCLADRIHFSVWSVAWLFCFRGHAGFSSRRVATIISPRVLIWFAAGNHWRHMSQIRQLVTVCASLPWHEALRSAIFQFWPLLMSMISASKGF